MQWTSPTCTQRERERVREIERKGDGGQRGRADRQIYRQEERGKGGREGDHTETDRQIDKQTDRQTDRDRCETNGIP